MNPSSLFASVWRNSNYRDALLAAFLGALTLILRYIPFIEYGRNPLGYDTGFYRRYLIQPFASFPNAPVPGLGDDALVPRIILDVLRLTHLPVDVILYGSYLLFWTLIPVVLFFWLRPHLGARGAFLAGILSALSAVAYNGYMFFLYKNGFALVLVLGAFIAFERRAILPLFALDALIGLTHKTSAVIYVLTLVFLFLISKGRRRELFLHLMLAGSIILSVNLPSVREAFAVLPSAVFLDWTSYLTLSAPLLLLAVVALFRFRTQAPPRTLIAFTLAGFLFPLLSLPFYERIFVFCDVALAGLAGYGAAFLLTKATKSGSEPRIRYASIAVLCMVCGLLLGNIWNQIISARPYMSDAAIAEIERVGALVPENATLLTTNDETPWVEGWTLAHVAGPGLLHDRHNLEAWTAFWEVKDDESKSAFLASFPQPLYITTLQSLTELIGTPPPCVTEVSAHLWKSECGN